MNAWNVIKRAFVRNEHPGSIGYLIKINAAADLYMELRTAFASEAESDEAFNADTEVRKALLMRGQLNAIQKLV
jgi:hypothetical protein